MSTFVAIDFETANKRRDSACALGLAVGCGGRVVCSRTYLIRPPSTQFTFTGLHGLGWKDVRDAPTFADLWPMLRTWIDDAAFVAAHNASFDSSVLRACCARYGVRTLPRRIPFACTVQLARAQWGIHPTKLPDVCRRLGLPLCHHEAGSDAEACARIVLAAEAKDGGPGGEQCLHSARCSAAEFSWESTKPSRAVESTPPPSRGCCSSVEGEAVDIQRVSPALPILRHDLDRHAVDDSGLEQRNAVIDPRHVRGSNGSARCSR